MSVKSVKPLKRVKIASFEIDILAVYPSTNETPVPVDLAMAKIQESLSKKSGTTRPKIQKCTLQIWNVNTESYTILMKSTKNKQVLESFTSKSMGTPQIGQLGAQDLVFLPVLNKDRISELFVFHPNSVTAQEIVIILVKLIQVKDAMMASSTSKSSPTLPNGEVEADVISHHTNEVYNHVFNGNVKENSDPEDFRSEYSLSSTFFNNWYCKIEQMVSNTPASLYQNSEYGSSIDDELHLLNQYLKEIRLFMNNFYDIMRRSINEQSIQNDTVTRIVKLPPKSNFVEIIQKAKYSLNLASLHNLLITNPSSKEIVNQLLLILKILADATIDRQTGHSDLVKGIRDPLISDSTAKYLTDNLTTPNKDFWITLGENYGYLEPKSATLPGLHRTIIDEFKIKKENNLNHEENNSPSYERSPSRTHEKSPFVNSEINQFRQPERFHEDKYRRNYDYDSRSDDIYPRNRLTHSQPQMYLPEKPSSATDFYDDDDVIYRSYPRMYEQSRRTHQLPVPTMLMHQKIDKINPVDNGYEHQNSSTWINSQNRFIDAVNLRNGRLLKITRERSAQNSREIAVSCNEAVELLTDYGDMIMVKNSLGEVGYCPSSIAQFMTRPI